MRQLYHLTTGFLHFPEPPAHYRVGHTQQKTPRCPMEKSGGAGDNQQAVCAQSHCVPPARGGVRQGRAHHSTKLALAGAPWVLPLPCCLDFSKSFNLPESLSALKQKFCHDNNSFSLITSFKTHFAIHDLKKSFYSSGPKSRPGPVASGLRRVHVIRKPLLPRLLLRCCLEL